MNEKRPPLIVWRGGKKCVSSKGLKADPRYPKTHSCYLFIPVLWKLGIIDIETCRQMRITNEQKHIPELYE